MPPPASLQGPTPGSNWLIPNRLLVGECPANEAEISPILQAGIDTFVCLLDKEDFATRGLSEREYKEITDGLQVVSVPIPDGDVTDDVEAFQLAADITNFLKRGGKAYLHCWGGHGRAGTIGALVLGAWTGWPLPEVLTYVSEAHALREEGGEHDSPQTIPQVMQIARFFLE